MGGNNTKGIVDRRHCTSGTTVRLVNSSMCVVAFQSSCFACYSVILSLLLHHFTYYSLLTSISWDLTRLKNTGDITSW